MQPQQSDQKNRIESAFAEQRFKDVLQLTSNYLSQFGQSKQILLIKAKANSQLSLPQQCLKDLQRATQLGSSLKQISTLKIRSLIQTNQTKQAEKLMKKLTQQDKQLKTALELYNAISLLNDNFQIHKLSKKQENIFQAMKSWLYKTGGNYDKLKPVNLYPGYRGVIATKHIKKKQRIVFIPKYELITLQMAKANPFSQSIIQKNIRLHSPKHTLLSILLLELKNTPDSKYKPYIDLLPEDHSCFPINYSKAELELLEGSPFLNMIYEKVIGLRKDYESVIKCDPKFQQKYPFRQFCWARNMVGSRIFGLVIRGVKTEILVPFADMLNHRHPKQTVWSYQQSMNGFVIESEEDIEVGQEVFDSYGRKCNSRYLLSYGFTLQDNEDNQISLKIEIDEKDPLAKMKKQIIKEDVKQTYTEIRKINFNFHNNKFYEFMGALRFITIDEEETLHMLKKISGIQVSKQPYLMVRTPPISLKSEIKVWTKLCSLCEDLLSKYPQTLEHDRNLLKNTELTPNQKNILNLRMGQKYILTSYISVCAEVIKILSSTDVIQALDQNKSKVYAKYLFKILSLTPGINKKNLQKKLSHNFSVSIEEKQLDETEEVAES